MARPVVHRAPSQDHEPATSPTLVRAPLDSFVGRTHEVDALLDRLSDTRCRLVSVTGPVGAGRRRLLVESLARCGVPAVVLDARTRAAGESVADFVARMLGVAHDRVAGVLGGGAVVLGFTDVDASSVTVADHAWIVDLLTIVPTVTVVVTAVSPLDVPGEWVVEVAPLLEDAAAALLVERAAAWSAAFARDADPDDEQVRALVRLGGGAPLAIEHLARRIAVHGVGPILQEMQAGSNTHALPGAIVRSTVEGWRRLPTGPRNLMAVLSVTRAAVDLADLVHLSVRGDHDERAPTADTLDDAVDVLIRRHLAEAVPSRRSRRFRAAPTAAAAVRDALAPEERRRVQDQHAAWVLRSMTDASDRLFGPDRPAAIRRLAALAADVEPALDHLESADAPVEVVRLLAAVVPTVAVTTGRDRAIDRLEGCLGSGGSMSLPVEVRARARAALAAALGQTSRVVDARRIRDHVESAVALAADIDHADARWTLAMAFSAFPSVNDPDYLRDLAELGRHRSADAGDDWMVARFTSYLAAAVHQTGDVDRAVSLAIDAAARAEALDDDHLRLRTAMVIAGLPADHLSVAPRPMIHDALALATRDGDPMTVAIVVIRDVVRAMLAGDIPLAARGVVRVLEVSRAAGVTPTEVVAMVLAAQVFALDGDDVRAARTHGAALRYRDVAAAISPRWWIASNDAWAEGLAGRLGDVPMATEVERGAAVPWTSAVLDTIADLRRLAERGVGGVDPVGARHDHTNIGGRRPRARGVARPGAATAHMGARIDLDRSTSGGSTGGSGSTVGTGSVSGAGTSGLRFTPREREVLDLLVQGWTDKRIAEQLGIRPKTVARHNEHLYRKLGVRSRAAAVATAYELGLVNSPTLN